MGHRIYPYLLPGRVIDRPKQVWAADITYIPMAKGFMYLVAIIDWYSRRVLNWRLSPTVRIVGTLALLESEPKAGGEVRFHEVHRRAQGSCPTKAPAAAQPHDHVAG